jgi:hypothetical protein
MFKPGKFNKWPLDGIEHVIMTGQSLGSGTVGVPIRMHRARGHRYLMFNGGAWGYGSQDNAEVVDIGRYQRLVPHRPKISSSYYTLIGETAFNGFKEYLHSKGYPDGSRSLLFSNVAHGGRYLWCLNKAGLALTSLTYSSPLATGATVYPYGTSGNLYIGTNWKFEVYGTSDPRFHGVVNVSGSSGLTFQYTPLFTPGASATGGYLRGLAYPTSLRQIETVQSILRGAPYRIGAILNIHGEGDRNNSDYDIQLRGWADDYDTDAKAMTGQATDVLMYNSQVSSFVVDQPSNLLLLDEHIAGNKNVLICPKYFLDHSLLDGVHMTPLSLERLGEYYGRAYYQKSILGQTYDPLYMLSAVHSASTNNTIARFNKIITKDTVNVSEHTNLGFTATDASGNVPITDIWFNPAVDDKVGILFDRAVSGTLVLNYAAVGTGGHGGPLTGPRGNIRAYETPEIGPLTGYPMYDWACHQQIVPIII